MFFSQLRSRHQTQLNCEAENSMRGNSKLKRFDFFFFVPRFNWFSFAMRVRLLYSVYPGQLWAAQHRRPGVITKKAFLGFININFNKSLGEAFQVSNNTISFIHFIHLGGCATVITLDIEIAMEKAFWNQT